MTDARRAREDQAGIVRPAATRAQACGADAERIAERFLTGHGLRILARNLRCRGGEIDLIGLHHDTVVFIEVRLRRNPRFGGAGASITPHKQQRIILAARWWLGGAGRAHANRPCRFDAVLFDERAARGDTPPEWLQGAFGTEGW
ncbi:MAG: YraN family protein [Rhodocyclaceae bacterium]|jgi:putative endonuclease|nr:YraN family protein [Rhodocyclaceae bacterium]